MPCEETDRDDKASSISTGTEIEMVNTVDTDTSNESNLNISGLSKMSLHTYPSNYFVGMIDILGFKKLISKNNDCLEKIYTTLYANFHDLPNYVKNGKSQFFRPYETGEGINRKPVSMDVESIMDSISIFSDTIFFYIEAKGTKEEIVEKSTR